MKIIINQPSFQRMGIPVLSSISTCSGWNSEDPTQKTNTIPLIILSFYPFQLFHLK